MAKSWRTPRLPRDIVSAIISAATNNVKRAADGLAGQAAMLKQEMDSFLAEVRAA